MDDSGPQSQYTEEGLYPSHNVGGLTAPEPAHMDRDGPSMPESMQTYEHHQWSSGLFGCFNNMGVCVLGFVLPCVLFGQTSDLLQGKSCLTYSLLFLIPVLHSILLGDQREVLRNIRAIPGSSGKDFLLACFCTPCALVQQAQEVEQLNVEGYAFPVHDQPLPTVSGGMYGATEAGFSPPSLDTSEAEQQYSSHQAPPDVVVQQQPKPL